MKKRGNQTKKRQRRNTKKRQVQVRQRKSRKSRKLVRGGGLFNWLKPKKSGKVHPTDTAAEPVNNQLQSVSESSDEDVVYVSEPVLNPMRYVSESSDEDVGSVSEYSDDDMGYVSESSDGDNKYERSVLSRKEVYLQEPVIITDGSIERILTNYGFTFEHKFPYLVIDRYGKLIDGPNQTIEITDKNDIKWFYNFGNHNLSYTLNKFNDKPTIKLSIDESLKEIFDKEFVFKMTIYDTSWHKLKKNFLEKLISDNANKQSILKHDFNTFLRDPELDLELDLSRDPSRDPSQVSSPDASQDKSQDKSQDASLGPIFGLNDIYKDNTNKSFNNFSKEEILKIVKNNSKKLEKNSPQHTLKNNSNPTRYPNPHRTLKHKLPVGEISKKIRESPYDPRAQHTQKKIGRGL